MNDVENKVLQFIKKNINYFVIIIFSILAIYVRIKLLSFESYDMRDFMNWLNYFKINGGLLGLKDCPTSYNMPYMTILALLSYLPGKAIVIIKTVPIIFDFLLAISVSMIIKTVLKQNKIDKNNVSIIGYCITLFIPTVLINSAMWGQCDSIYTFFVLMSLYFLIKSKYNLSFVFLGISFAFKLQFVFILPLYIIIYFTQKKFSIVNFLIIPLVNLAMCIPAIIFGRSVLECIKLYFVQANTFSKLNSLNIINLGQLFGSNAEYIYPFLTCLTIAILGLILYFCIIKNVRFNNEKILCLGLWSIIITTFFLPSMHERYLYMAEVLSIIVLLIYKKHLLLCLIINFFSLITYSTHLLEAQNVNYQYLLIIYIVLIALFTKDILGMLITDEKQE